MIKDIMMNSYVNRQAANYERLPGSLYIHYAAYIYHSAWLR